MELKIDLNQIRNDFTNAFGQLATTLGNWKGRMISLLTSGSEKVAPYFQDKRIAAVSLVGLNILLLEIDIKLDLGNYVRKKFNKNDHLALRLFYFSCAISPSIIGVTAFAKFAKPALSPLQITAISIATFAGNMWFYLND